MKYLFVMVMLVLAGCSGAGTYQIGGQTLYCEGGYISTCGAVLEKCRQEGGDGTKASIYCVHDVVELLDSPGKSP